MTRLALVGGCLLAAAAGQPRYAAAPPTESLGLEIEQRLRLTAAGPAAPAQQRRRGLKLRLAAAAAGAGHWRWTVRRVAAAHRLGEQEIDPLGAEQLQGKALVAAIGPAGPAGPEDAALRIEPAAGLDATWAAALPWAELLRLGLRLGLPPLPAEPLRAGDCWSAEQRLPAALPGAEGLEIALWSVFTATGFEDCPAGRCARIEQIGRVSLVERRPLGDSMVTVDFFGGLRASHLLGPAGPLASSGRLELDCRLLSHPAPGLPPRFATRAAIELDYRSRPAG
jgi:hypothetical protein